MTGTTEDLFENIRKLSPAITSRVAEIEDGRRTPPDLVDALKSIGVFRLFVPRSHGGLELDLPTALEVIKALSRIDGSVGWNVAIAAGWDLVASLLPRETYERVYEDAPDAIIAGSTQPAGIARPAVGGWRVNGRWPFASGCQHANWMFGFCLVTERRNSLSGIVSKLSSAGVC